MCSPGYKFHNRNTWLNTFSDRPLTSIVDLIATGWGALD